MIKVNKLTDQELLALYGAVMDDMRRRKLVRSSNNPAADYAEGLMAGAFKLKLNTASTAGYDGIDPRGKKYEVKCRRPTLHNKSRQLSAIRGLEKKHFDYVAGILLNVDFTVLRAALIPYAIVKKRSKYVAGTNSWRFILHDSVWSLPGVKDITKKLREAQKWK